MYCQRSGRNFCQKKVTKKERVCGRLCYACSYSPGTTSYIEDYLGTPLSPCLKVFSRHGSMFYMGACSTYGWASCKRIKASGNSPQPLLDGDHTSASLPLCKDNSEACSTCISEIRSQMELQPHTAVT